MANTPIPSGIYFIADWWNFYDAKTGAGKGDEFLQTWISRREEFPQTRAEAERLIDGGQPEEVPDVAALAPTEGPWFVAERPLVDGRARIENGTSEGFWIAACEWQNAHLIAASSEMLDLLRACRQKLRSDPTFCDRIDAVIAKAEGR